MTPEKKKQTLARLCKAGDHPNSSPYPVIGHTHIIQLAKDWEMSLLDVEIFALDCGIMPARYVRNTNAILPQDQACLLQAKAVVVGAGGLGGNVCEMLARLGVGTVTVVDGDVFEETNLNRQIISLPDQLEKQKAQLAAARIAAVNPAVCVKAVPKFLDADNAQEILADATVVLDCIGGLTGRLTLQKAAQALGIVVVSAAVAGFSGHITTIFPSDTGLFALYGQDEQDGGGAETELGCPAPSTAMLACLQCSEAVKVLTRKGSPLSGRLLAFDLLDNTFDLLDIG